MNVALEITTSSFVDGNFKNFKYVCMSIRMYIVI